MIQIEKIDDDLQHYFTSVEIERTDGGAIGYTNDKEED